MDIRSLVRSLFPSYCVVLLVLVATAVQPIVAAFYCSFWNHSCVDPMAQTVVPFIDFRPLYPDGLSLYYAFDASSPNANHDTYLTKTALWMQYRANRINSSAIDANRTLELAMRVGNITGPPGGGHNGCDGVWGSECSASIVKTLQNAIYTLSASGENYTYPLQTVLEDMSVDPPSGFACSPHFFDVQSISSMSFASESTPESVLMRGPGSVSYPWLTFYTNNMSASSQADQVAVAIISRSPAYGWPALNGPDDVQIQLACVQAPS